MATAPINARAARLMPNYEQYQAQLAQVTRQAVALSFDWATVRGVCTEKIIGQNEAIDRIIFGLRRNASPTRTKPFGAFLFVGPPGTGKTELAKSMGPALGLFYRKFDLASVSGGPESLTPIFGVPTGYQGAGHGAMITDIQQHNEGCVFLLDEFEKPLLKSPVPENSPLATAFYGPLNDGTVISGYDSSPHDAKKSVFVFTANLKYKEVSQAQANIGSLYLPGADPETNPTANLFDGQKMATHISELKQILHDNGNGLPMPLLDRFGTNIIVFKPIDPESAGQMATVCAEQQCLEKGFVLDAWDHMLSLTVVRQLVSSGANISGRLVDQTVGMLIGYALTQFECQLMDEDRDTRGMRIGLTLDEGSGNVIVQTL